MNAEATPEQIDFAARMAVLETSAFRTARLLLEASPGVNISLVGEVTLIAAGILLGSVCFPETKPEACNAFARILAQGVLLGRAARMAEEKRTCGGQA